MDVKLAFNKFRKQASMKKEALIAGGMSYMSRSNENPESFGDNLVRSIITEAGANAGGSMGTVAGLALAKALQSKDSSNEANVAKAALAVLLGSIGGYGLGGYATHKLTKNKSNKRKAKREELEDKELYED